MDYTSESTGHAKFAQHLQMTVECAEPDFARVSMPLDEVHINRFGAAHGGVIAALADVAFGAAANARRETGIVTLSTGIDYLRPGRKGPLIAEARSIRRGGHIVHYEVDVFDAEKTLLAKVMITGYITDVRLPD